MATNKNNQQSPPITKDDLDRSNQLMIDALKKAFNEASQETINRVSNVESCVGDLKLVNTIMSTEVDDVKKRMERMEEESHARKSIIFGLPTTRENFRQKVR